jgi:hypothetical protein
VPSAEAVTAAEDAGTESPKATTVSEATRAWEGEKEFRAWWPLHDAKGPGIGRKEFDHPLVGRLALDYVCAHLPGTLDQQLVTYTAPAGSPAQAALDRLAAARPDDARAGSEVRSGA